MVRPAEFSDPRLVAIYDTANSYAPETQPAFYSGLAAELGARSIVDLGCGTGIITCELARIGYTVVGVDPSPEMLAVARRRPDSERVTWIEGDASRLGRPGFDMAIMTGHVAQFFITDDSWRLALDALNASLRPGGHLAFESRNPEAREWERWTPDRRRVLDDSTAGVVQRWPEVHEVRDGIVSYTIHHHFLATGEDVAAPTDIRFRTRDELTGSLEEAGFTVQTVYGDWDRRTAAGEGPELIFVAERSDPSRARKHVPA